MTDGTIRWKLIGGVVWVSHSIVICCMTTITSVWRVIVVSVVAGRTIICDWSMCPVQCIIIVVYWEGSRFPSRGSRVTGSAIQRNIQCPVIGVGSTIIIRCMTCRTLGRGTCIPGSVTLDAICGKVRSGQGKIGCVVVKDIVRIPGRVAGQTSGTFIGITSYAVVLLVSFRIGVAGDASEFRIICRIGVTINT